MGICYQINLTVSMNDFDTERIQRIHVINRRSTEKQDILEPRNFLSSLRVYPNPLRRSAMPGQ